MNQIIASSDESTDLGAQHEQNLAAKGTRKTLGAYYTPSWLVEGVLDLAFSAMLNDAAGRGVEAVGSLRVLDPACGSGRFLVAVKARITGALVALGQDREVAEQIARRCLFGFDVDPMAIELAGRELAGHELDGHELAGRDLGCTQGLRVLDALNASPESEPLLEPGSFDLVVGNPPFLNQLSKRSARDRTATAALRERFGAAIGPYTDPAAAFMLLGAQLAQRNGGVVAMVEPMSLIASRDAGGVRRALSEAGALEHLWLVGGGAFDASVEVCVPVVRMGAEHQRTQVTCGHSPAEFKGTFDPSEQAVTQAGGHAGAGGGSGSGGVNDGAFGGGVKGAGGSNGAREASWSEALALSLGVPRVELGTDGELGDIAVATADFRDQYYGLGPHVVDLEIPPSGGDASWPKLITSGLIDPAHLLWGTRPTRFNKRTFSYLRVNRSQLPEPLQRWAETRLVPKVMVATQTKIPEAVVDSEGEMLPSVPVISAVPNHPADLWKVAAVLTCPTVAALGARRHLGSALSSKAFRMRATDVMALPLPTDLAEWNKAAALLQAQAPLVEVGEAMNRAYGLGSNQTLCDELTAWWLGQMPTR